MIEYVGPRSLMNQKVLSPLSWCHWKVVLAPWTGQLYQRVTLHSFSLPPNAKESSASWLGGML